MYVRTYVCVCLRVSSDLVGRRYARKEIAVSRSKVRTRARLLRISVEIYNKYDHRAVFAVVIRVLAITHAEYSIYNIDDDLQQVISLCLPLSLPLFFFFYR